MEINDDPKYLKRKVKSGAIDVHPTEKALIVNYELEAIILGDKGSQLHGDKKECQKIIRLKTLNSRTDCQALAKSVLEKCNLIHPSKLNEVEQLLQYLKNRKPIVHRSASISSGRRSSRSSSVNHTNNLIEEQKKAVQNGQDLSSISIGDLDQYVELLYEDIQQKIKGAAIILELAKNPDNLEEISKNEAVLSALTRVLREDWRKSLDLSINIVGTLFYFSHYEDFHPVIIHYKIGSLCMYLLEQELQRYEDWSTELENLSKSKLNNENNRMSQSYSMGEIKKSRIPEPKQKLKPKASLLNDQSRLSSPNMSSSLVCLSDSFNQLYDSALSIEETMSYSSSDIDQTYSQTRQKQLKLLQKKQNQLIHIIIYLLLNISQDPNIEEKMANKSICQLLVKSLQQKRDLNELTMLIVTFLKKLSIYDMNVIDMFELNVVKILKMLILDGNNKKDAELVHVTLKLLFNLSFDSEICEQMISEGLFTKYIELLRDDKHRSLILKILYHLSMDKRKRHLFASTDSVDLLIDMLLISTNIELEIIALCVNLARDPDCVEQILVKNSLKDLIIRATQLNDPLLMKMIRNISRHSYAREFFLDFVPYISEGMNDPNLDYAIECIGTMANLNLPEIDYLQLFKQLKIVQLVNKFLLDESIEDDFKLEIVLMLGTAVQDESCAEYVCSQDQINSVIEPVIKLLNDRQTDDEIVLQIIFFFYQLLVHKSTRLIIRDQTEVVAYIIDLMRDKNKTIRKWCNYCLDTLTLDQTKESNENELDWCEKVKREKFRAYNAEWLEIIENTTDLNQLQFDDPLMEGEDNEELTTREKLNTIGVAPRGQRIALDLEMYDDKHILKHNYDDRIKDIDVPFLGDEEEPFIPLQTAASLINQNDSN